MTQGLGILEFLVYKHKKHLGILEFLVYKHKKHLGILEFIPKNSRIPKDKFIK